MKEAVLDVKNLTMCFGGLKAVDNFSIKVYEKDLTAIIGPNGAGKTTIFNMITGVYIPTEGQIFLGGEDITDERPANINHKGIARTFQNIRLFKELTVLDNIRLACHHQVKYSLFSSLFRTPSFKSEEEEIKEKSIELLKIFNLDKKTKILAKNLPYGEQRRLEIVRALATNPKVLLLDEPAAGMNPIETQELTELIRWIRDKFHLSILLIEHDMNLVMKLCENIYVVDYGAMISCGGPSDVQNDPKVIEAYLGAEHD